MIKIVLSFAASFAMAVALFFLWGWFVVPLGLPSIGIFHAWGLIFVAQALSFDSHQMVKVSEMPDEERERYTVKNAVMHFGGAVIVGLLGLGVHYASIALGGF